MANVIEILIQAKNNATAEIEKASGGMAKFASTAGLAGAAGGLAGAAIVTAMQGARDAIIGTTTAFADEVEQLDRMSASTGLTVTQLQVFRSELEQGGLSADQLGISMRFFQNQIASGGMEKLGVSSHDTFTALQQLGVVMRNTGGFAERTELAAKSLGMRNVELAANVLATAAAYKEKLNVQMENGSLISDTAAGKFRDLDESLDTFGLTVKSFKIATADMFAPMIKGAADALTNMNKLAIAFKTIEEKDVQRMKELSDRLTPSGNKGMASAHGNVTTDYDRWVNFFTPKPGGGGGGGGGGGKPLPISGAQGFEPNAIASVMQLLSQYLQSQQGALKTSMGRGFDGSTLSSKDASDPIVKSFSRIEEAAMQFGSNFEGSLRSTLSQAFAITTASNNLIVQAFTSLANAVTQTIADMMARAAAMGLVKLALNFLPGGGGAGAKIDKVFGAKMGASPLSMSAGGGNTFVIQSINSRDAMEAIMNPTGSFRRANDRMRDINAAAMG